MFFRRGLTLPAARSRVVLAAAALAFGLVRPAVADVAVVLAADPSPVVTGSVLTVTLTVTNTGGFDETGVTAELEVNAGAPALQPLSGPVPAGPLTVVTGTTESFVWTFSVTGSAWLSFTATATTAVPAVASVSATAAVPATVAAAVSVSRNPAPVGAWWYAMLTVTNTGGVDAVDVVPTLSITGGGAHVNFVSGPFPPSFAALNPGPGPTFTWQMLVEEEGTLEFTLSVTAGDAVFGGTIGAAPAPVSVPLLKPAALSASIFASPYWITVGNAFGIMLTVSNSGGFAATGVVPTFEVNEGAAGPFDFLSPASADIQPGSTTVFFVGLHTSGPGVVRFTVTMDGFDTGLLGPVSASGSSSATVLTPATLTASLLAGPSPLSAGAVLTVTLWVQNAGEEQALVTPHLGISFGAGLVAPRSAPDPVPTDIAGLNLVPFVWTFSVSGCGAVGFTASVSGNAMIVFVPVSAWAASAPVTLKGDAWDPTDDVTAGAVGVPAISTGTAHGPHVLCAADQADWFAMSLLAGRAYEFTTAGGSGDGYGELFSDASASQVLAFDDDSAGGNQPAVDFTPESTATRFLRIRAIPAGSDWSGVLHVREKLAAAASVTPAVTQIGRWVTLRLTVTNNGTADLLGPAPSVSVFSGAGWIELIAAPAGIPSVAAGTAATFIWTYSVSGAGAASLRVAVAGTDAVTGHTVAAWTTAVITGTNASALAASLAATPGVAPVGSWVSVVLTVTNTGGSSALGVTPGIQANAGGTLVVAQSGPVPAGPVTIAAGGVQSFAWTYSVSGAGTVGWTATAAGLDAVTFVPVGAAASGALLAGTPASLAASLAAWSPPAVTGQVVTVALTVTNTGGTTATGALPALTPSGGLDSLTGPVPAGPVAIPAGAAQSFVWTFSATGCGPVTLTGALTGTDATTGAPVTVSATATGQVKGDAFDPADDTATAGTLLAPPPGAWGVHGPHALCAGDTADWYRVALAQGAAYRFETAGIGDAFAELVDDAAATQVLAADDDGAGAQQPRLSFTPSRAGTFWLRVRSVPAGGDWTGDLRHRRLLGASLAISPAAAVIGQPVEIVLTVTNTGAADLTGGTGALALPVGLGLLTAPVPATIPAGGSASFTWTVSVTAAGTVTLTATLAGTEQGTGLPLATWGTAGLTALQSAALSATLTLTATPPPDLLTGGRVVAVFAVANHGDSDVAGALPAAGPSTGGGLLAAVSGPLPTGPVTIPAHGAVSFTWTLSLTGAGAFAMTATVTGADAVTGAPVAVVRTAGAVIERRADLAVTLAAPVAAKVGEMFDTVLDGVNTGDAPLSLQGAVFQPAEPGLFEIVSGPAGGVPGSLAPGADVHVRWKVRALRGGVAGFSVVLMARRDADGSDARASVATALAVTERFSAPVVAWPNPAHGDDVHVALKLAGPADRVVVEVYSAAFRRIAEGEWRFVRPGADAQLRFTGVRGWAPGVYLVRAKAWYPGGTSETFAPVKVAVKR